MKTHFKLFCGNFEVLNNVQHLRRHWEEQHQPLWKMFRWGFSTAAACLWTTDTVSVHHFNYFNTNLRYFKITLTIGSGSIWWDTWPRPRRGSDQEAQHWRLSGGRHGGKRRMFLALNQVAACRRCIFEAFLHGDRAASWQNWQMLWQMHWISLDHSDHSRLFYISYSSIQLFYWYFLPTFWSFGSDSGLDFHGRKSTPPPVLKKPKFSKATDLNPTFKVRSQRLKCIAILRKLCSYQKTLKMSFQFPFFSLLLLAFLR